MRGGWGVTLIVHFQFIFIYLKWDMLSTRLLRNLYFKKVNYPWVKIRVGVGARSYTPASVRQTGTVYKCNFREAMWVISQGLPTF